MPARWENLNGSQTIACTHVQATGMRARNERTSERVVSREKSLLMTEIQNFSLSRYVFRISK